MRLRRLFADSVLCCLSPDIAMREAFPGSLMVVPDSHKDPRFAKLPATTGPLKVRFYAGAPINTSDGKRRGAGRARSALPLCVIGVLVCLWV